MYYIRHFMYHIRQACTISDMHVLYPTCIYYIRQVCILSDIAYIISDSHVLYPKWPVLYPTCTVIASSIHLHTLPQFNEFNGHSLTNTKIVIYYSTKNHFFPPIFILPLIFFPPSNLLTLHIYLLNMS